MESFDFAVGLWSVGPGAFVPDAELDASVVPGEGAVSGGVVELDSFDDESALAEPGDRSPQDSGRGVAAFVGADLGVGDAGTVDDGVQERFAVAY